MINAHRKSGTSAGQINLNAQDARTIAVSADRINLLQDVMEAASEHTMDHENCGCGLCSALHRYRLQQTPKPEFERWMIEDYKCIIGSSDPYPSGIERDMRKCWNAATNAKTIELHALISRIKEIASDRNARGEIMRLDILREIRDHHNHESVSTE